MTRLIVTTNRREAHFDETSGWIFIVDLENQKILRQSRGVEPPYRSVDHNPRGGMRGMRGLSFFNGELATADYSSIFFFDKNWNLIRTISHPAVSGIHELLYVENGIWATSTVNDMLVRFNLDGNLSEYHYLREQKDLMQKIQGPQKILINSQDIEMGRFDFRNRSYFKTDTHDRIHLNGVTLSPDGRLFMSFGLIVGDAFGILMNLKTIMRRMNVWNMFLTLNRFIRQLLGLKKKMLSDLVFQPSQGKSAVVSWDFSSKWDLHIQFPVTHNPSHSVRVLDDGTCVYLNSSHGRIIHFKQDGTVISSEKVTDNFIRGLLAMPGDQLIVGADNNLLIYDITAHRVISEFQITDDPKNSVFDIQIFPPEFKLPPLSLEEITGKAVGFDGQNIVWEGQGSANPDPDS